MSWYCLRSLTWYLTLNLILMSSYFAYFQTLNKESYGIAYRIKDLSVYFHTD